MNQFTLDVRTTRLFLSFLTAFCLMPGSAILLAQESGESDQLPLSKPIVLKLDYRRRSCAAHLSLEYYQSGENAHVKASLTNEDCDASSGDYILEVRYRDENNEVRNIDYAESWARSDDSPVQLARNYLIGKNVDLVRVRSRDLRCECTAVPPDENTSDLAK